MPVSKISLVHVPVPVVCDELGICSAGEREQTWWLLQRLRWLLAMLWCLLVCSHVEMCNSHAADSDPYCCGLTGGGVICEMMALMPFISSVRRLLPRTWEYLCKYM